MIKILKTGINMIEFNKLIRRYRKSLRMTQKEFGDKYGRIDRTVMKWEQGVIQAPYKVLSDAIINTREII